MYRNVAHTPVSNTFVSPITSGGARLCAGLLVFILICAVGCGGDGEQEFAFPGFGDPDMSSKDAMLAKRTLENYFDALGYGDYEAAADEFSGDVRFLRDLNQDVAPDDYAELISRYCRLYGGACYPAEILKGKKADSGKFVFTVRFLGPDGEIFETGDPLFSETLEREFSFRVEKIGTRYFVLDLPPRAGSH